ncbi:hypothetical protein M2408_001736 [Sphingobacterium sp. BIGb0165]|nr:hypothetical protein [Sphingobacterium sp. BIGb0165]
MAIISNSCYSDRAQGAADFSLDFISIFVVDFSLKYYWKCVVFLSKLLYDLQF